VAADRGLLDADELRGAESRLRREEAVLDRANGTVLAMEEANLILDRKGSAPVRESARVSDLARRPGVPLAAMLAVGGLEVDDEACHWADVELKYAGYLAREQGNAQRLLEMEALRLPADLAYGALRTLSFEAREKLDRIRPASLGQAARIPGVSPSDLHNLLAEVMRRRQPG
jgi:NAD/FAD-utilizing enzyme apparently involved in cell division